MAKNNREFKSNGKLIEVELADRYKLVLHNKDMHGGCFYIEDEWDITLYAPTIKKLIDQAAVAIVLRLIDVGAWELEQCQVFIYDGNIYEIECFADVKKEYDSLVSNIISTDSYKDAYLIRQKECDEEIRKLKERLHSERKQKAKEQKKA